MFPVKKHLSTSPLYSRQERGFIERGSWEINKEHPQLLWLKGELRLHLKNPLFQTSEQRSTITGSYRQSLICWITPNRIEVLSTSAVPLLVHVASIASSSHRTQHQTSPDTSHHRNGSTTSTKCYAQVRCTFSRGLYLRICPFV